MTKHFGKTWWGEQWLYSLNNIDFSNRLPRGSSYARRGAVQKITINGNKIDALVSGSRPKPYAVSIILPVFSGAKLSTFLDTLSRHPGVISKLLNRELDPLVLELAQKADLKVFPSEWRDLSMKCSCPDWAVPCKHLAAVIYKICAEIDNNPFLVFNLHDVDLLEALNKRGIFISEQHAAIPTYESYCLSNSAKKITKSTYETENSYLKLKYGMLTPIHESLIALLTDAPAFYQGTANFKDKYRQHLKVVASNAEKLLSGKIVFDKFSGIVTASETPGIGRHSKVYLHTNNRLEWRILMDQKEIDFESFTAVMLAIPPATIYDYQSSTATLYHAIHFCFQLLAKGAIVPQILLDGQDNYVIRWLPAMLSKQVRELTFEFASMLPPDIFVWEGNTAEQPISQDVEVNLLSLFLSAFVRILSARNGEDLFTNLFFFGQKHAFNRPGEEAISGGIQTWLQRYYLSHGKYIPQIIVEERPQDESFLIDIDVILEDKGASTPVSLQLVLQDKKYEKIKFEVLKSLSLLSHFITGLDAHINANGATSLLMNNETFTHFLMQMVPVIQLLNIDILLPKSLQAILKPKASVKIKANPGASYLKLDQLLDFDWQIAIGNSILNEADFKKLLKKSDGLIKYKSQYIYVNKEDLQKLHAHFNQSRDLSSFELLRTALSGDYLGADISITKEVTQIIKKITQTEEVSLPKLLRADLRPYQRRGFSWMYRNAKIGFGSVIADDMGLGKTLQVITTLLKHKEEGYLKDKKVLIVAPTGVLTNWIAEIEKFAPSLQTQLFHGSNRLIEKGFDILLTSYGVIRREATRLKKMPWHSLVIDEAQNIKNQDTRQAKAIKSIPADNYIAMSGTPVENRLSELWSILDFSNRGILGSLKEFQETFGRPIETFNDESVALKLRKVTAPFMMRRLKTDKKIISDLPDKIEMDCFANLVGEQASLYESTLQEAMKEIEAIDAADKKGLFVRRGLVLQLILALKQICNHPSQFLKNNVLNNTLSGKLDLLFDKLDSIVESGEKVLIFTQFAEMGRLLEHFITERYGDMPLFYHGGCSLKQRNAMIEGFQQNPADKIFILSLKAAGTGLNLTAASHVIHYDLWWNPAVEAQATDRAYRIGQNKNVMVHRFITKNTFEERINEMIQSKKALAGLTVSTGENWIGNLSNKELKEIFKLK
ncbi:MAG TPA: DEAD/DEAH box helicase [Arachidicoccus sp.]|nr:DEAD/DEAH box helicase [Arachidicoccus sp.]